MSYFNFIRDFFGNGQDPIIQIIELLGTIAFAISGVRLASAKSFDWFGAFVAGFVVAVGGGTLRDLLIGVPVFWMQNIIYAWCTVLALVIVAVFRKSLVRLSDTIFWFDTLGLALFNLIGFEKTLNHGYPIWLSIIMGTMTGVFGGVIRDVLINEVPIIFRREIYASACLLGGILYATLLLLNVELIIIQISVFIFVVVVRYLAMKYNIGLPTLKPDKID